MYQYNSVANRHDRLSQVTGRTVLPSLDAFSFTAAGMAVLLIGSWVPDARLMLVGLPVNTVLLAVLLVMATSGAIKRQTLINVSVAQIPFILLGMTLFWSPDPAYGLDKFTTLVVSGNISFLLFNTVIERHGSDELIRILLGIAFFLLVSALIYKLIFGFFDRRVHYFMNGAIIFGRLMSIAALLAFFRYRGMKKALIVTLFVLAVLWTQSKGPVLAILATISIAAIYIAPRGKRAFIMLSVALIVAYIIYLSKYVFDPAYLGRLGVIFSIMAGDFDVLQSSINEGSLGIRVDMWSKSLGFIPSAPLGVGLGGWSYWMPAFSPLSYPHNIFCELWVEGGVIIGTLAIWPFVIFLFARKNMFTFIALLLLLTQLVSGDLADARMLLTFSLLAVFSNNHAFTDGLALHNVKPLQ